MAQIVATEQDTFFSVMLLHFKHTVSCSEGVRLCC